MLIAMDELVEEDDEAPSKKVEKKLDFNFGQQDQLSDDDQEEEDDLLNEANRLHDPASGSQATLLFENPGTHL